jgi:excinuclease UvrABC nuclease subunit
VIGNLRYEIEQVLDMKPSEILTTFLASHYIESDHSDVGLPDTIALEISIEDEAILEYFREKKVRIDTPRSGPRHELLAFTKNQLREYAYKSELATLEQKTLTREHMVHILERL